ncbi:MAG: hypothetical protein D6785_12440 [Planctomycetota bacterium]|nr:MAG: hypothetical protein D6785_12440 [Planctomycetota bacterium]
MVISPHLRKGKNDQFIIHTFYVKKTLGKRGLFSIGFSIEFESEFKIESIELEGILILYF